MSLWEFKACVDGWYASNGVASKVAPPSDEEFWDAVHGQGKWASASGSYKKQRATKGKTSEPPRGDKEGSKGATRKKRAGVS